MLTVTQRVRVEWAHCDPAGIIFNPHYYIWMDSGTHALITAAGFDLFGEVARDPLFRGCPLVASSMEFSRPLYLGDITVCSSRVERFGDTSFVVAHAFRQGAVEAPVAIGKEVRVWGGSDPEHPERLQAQRMPDELRAMLSVENTIDVTV